MSRMLYHLSYAAVIFFRSDYNNGSPFCQQQQPPFVRTPYNISHPGSFPRAFPLDPSPAAR